MAPVTQGKRAGTRPKRRLRPALLVLALGVTLAVVAWGYLVYAAIDFGADARAGDQQAWWFLAMASVGAIACLFLGLILIARITRTLGLTRAPEKRPKRDPSVPSGGHRAHRH